jgi:hypothetical protein
MENFLDLTSSDRLEALQAASSASGRPIHLLEKDVWVVWSLHQLFSGNHGKHLVFKGGTSLSKAYDVIRRFSEDIDLTYDIRAIAPDLFDGKNPPFPSTKSQATKWKGKIADRLESLLTKELLPVLSAALAPLSATARADKDRIYVEYKPLATGTGYVKPTIILDFGARSTGEPHEARVVRCDAAQYLPEISFPEATPTVMSPLRTFWEKATAIHVFCHQGEFRGGDHRFSRHWHDLTRLDATGFADDAIRNRQIGKDVAAHKAIFFAEKHGGKPIDYRAAVSGSLRLVPTQEKTLATLEDDYNRMVEDGLLMDRADSFQSLMKQCANLAAKANEQHE